MKINLSKALKIKNKLVTRITEVRDILTRENSRELKSPSTTDCAKVKKEIDASLEDLIVVKTMLAKANVEIYAAIYRMAELKGSAVYLKGLSTFRGERRERLSLNDIEKVQYVSYLSQEDVDKAVSECNIEIARLQDIIDSYNAETLIDMPDEILKRSGAAIDVKLDAKTV